MKTMVSHTLSVHKEHELLLKLEIAGLSEELAQKVIDSKGNELATKVVKFIQNGGFGLTSSQKRAREIMGHNFFGIEETIQHFGVNPSRQQIAALAEIPFSEAVLEQSKDTHILVAVFPLSILEIRRKVNSKLFCRYNEKNWSEENKEAFNKESFVKEHGETSWQLVCKTHFPDSREKNWSEQQYLIAKDDEVLTPTARVMVYTIIGHYLATGERLFKRIYVRTSSVDSDGHRVHVGYFEWRGFLYFWYGRGLGINYSWDIDCFGDVGVSSARKF